MWISDRNDELSSTWQIVLKNGNKEGKILKNGDFVYLINQYGRKAYLTTNGDANCQGLYHVETRFDLNQDKNDESSTWQIVIKNHENTYFDFSFKAIKKLGLKTCLYTDICPPGYYGPEFHKRCYLKNAQPNGVVTEIGIISGTKTK